MKERENGKVVIMTLVLKIKGDKDNMAKTGKKKTLLILDKYFLLIYLLSSLNFIKEGMFKIPMCYT